MSDEAIPYNKVGTSASDNAADAAERDGISEEEWRARNLPAEKLEFRWRYTNKTIHLYERRLRSLGVFNVGPAVQAWVRSRLEWVRDNKFYDMPDGVIVLTIDPEGVVDIQQEALPPLPDVKEGQSPRDVPGTPWSVRAGRLVTAEEPMHAADTLVRDLATTLGYEIDYAMPSPEDDEVFAASDEFGIIPITQNDGPVTQRLVECFDKLWTLKR